MTSIVSTAVPVIPAQAAVEYVKICTSFGAGYYYIPGTDTCVNADTGETKRITSDGTVDGSTALRDEIDQANEGVALSLALPTATVDPGKTFGAAINIGTFEGETAIGIGGAFKPNDNLTFNASVGAGTSHGTVGGRAGINVSW